ncbi:tRNA (adenosine(37)-N6)-dimethylallyltransferase MiaA [bacterium]|nr:tRNA (adenosine(37)-N6)-dimethylallyltransferase MiaA [bacterium]
MKPLVVIGGPTASGKSEVGYFLAKKLKGEVVSADSRQIYRYMDIGTAKPEKEILEGVVHHLIGIINPDEVFDAASFKRLAEKAIEDIHERDYLPFLVGGTGLYIRSVVEGLFPSPGSCSELRDSLQREANEFGVPFLHEKLAKIDPVSAARISKNDLRRIIRALEVYYRTGKPISYYQEHKTKKGEYSLAMIALDLARGELYQRIERRVDRMIQAGLIDEVKHLLQMGYQEDLLSMEGIGYQEIINYLKGDISLDAAKETIKKRTRNYAKRQLTWFRNKPKFNWFGPDEKEKILEFVKERLKLTTQPRMNTNMHE